MLRKFYEKQEVWFAVCWILLYCFVCVPIRGSYGDDSPWMSAVLAVITAGLLLFVLRNGLAGKYGLDRWPSDGKRYLYFIPMWILTTGNLWGGISARYGGIRQIFAVLTMVLVGFVEEMIFRGFLFRGLLKEHGEKTAVIISAVTFGMGHIVNLLTGQANAETIIQILFAVAWGFLFTLVYYKSGSLLPCILAHMLIDVFSTFAAENSAAEQIYVTATIVVSCAYCFYLRKQKSAFA